MVKTYPKLPLWDFLDRAVTAAGQLFFSCLTLKIWTWDPGGSEGSDAAEISYIRLTRNQKSEIRYQKSRFSHFKNGRVLVMRMRNTNSSKMRAIIGKMGRVTIYYACAVPFESRKYARWLYCACALQKHAHFLDQKSPEICLKSEIKLDFEISYALERRVGPLGRESIILLLQRGEAMILRMRGQYIIKKRTLFPNRTGLIFFGRIYLRGAPGSAHAQYRLTFVIFPGIFLLLLLYSM